VDILRLSNCEACRSLELGFIRERPNCRLVLIPRGFLVIVIQSLLCEYDNPGSLDDISHSERSRSCLDPSLTSLKLASTSGTRKGPGRRTSSSSATLFFASAATRAPQHRQQDSEPSMPAGVPAYVAQSERSPHERVVSALINRLKSKVRVHQGLARCSFLGQLMTICSVSAASMQ
jgi:hypothetical protein